MRPDSLERVETFLVGLIQQPVGARERGRAVRATLWVLRQLSFVYHGVVQLRLWLYRTGIFRHHTLGCQVISVGNLTVGGTGKTPVVEVFARELQKSGRNVAVLSRGYKKREPSMLRRIVDKCLLRDLRRDPRVVSDGSNLLLDSAMSGDEPYMLASNLRNVVVLVDKNRVKSGKFAIRRFGCDTLILDDGFQYLSLKHRMQIVLVDRTNPFGNDCVLPRGILREPARNLRRADFIFITKSDGAGAAALRARIRELNDAAEIIECKHCPRYLRNVFTAEQKDLAFLRDRIIVAMSGIAVPAGFEEELERRGARIVGRYRFADHHRYTQQEVIDIVNQSRLVGADAIVTTEKDAVRFPRLDRCDVPIFFLRVDIEILAGAADFQECISRICFRRHRPDAAGSRGDA